MVVFRPNIPRLVASGNITGLIGATTYSDQEIRRNAVAALGRMRDPIAYRALLNALRDDYRPVRIEAIQALGALGEPSCVNSLQWTLNDPDPTVRIQAIWALRQIGGPDIVKPLILSMADKEKEVRIKAVEAVISIGEAALAELRKAISGRNQLVRQNVINVLGRTKQQKMVPEIIRALDDPAATVRENAVWALGNIGDPRAVPNLEKMRSRRAAKSLRAIKEGPNWKVVVKNYEKAGRFEDAAVIYEMKSQWEEAGRLRNKAKEPASSSQATPQILANNLNLKQETIIKDSVISRSRIGRGETRDSIIHRSRHQGTEKRNEVMDQSPEGIKGMKERLNLEIRDGSKAGSTEEPFGTSGDDSDNSFLQDSNDAWVDVPEEEMEIESADGHGSSLNQNSVLNENHEPDRTTRLRGGGEGRQTQNGMTHDGYKICPFCGMELKFGRSPNFCPYCAEKLSR